MLCLSCFNTLRVPLVLSVFLFISSPLLAQEIESIAQLNPQFESMITEADIIPDYVNKYPAKRWENLQPTTDFYQSPYQISLFSNDNGEDKERLWSQTKAIFGYGLGVIGFIALLPEDISHWDNEEGIR